VPELARAAGVDTAYLYRILAGEAAPSDQTRAKLAGALGADLALRLYPNTGPLVRWSAEKADALPSWAGWGDLGPPPQIRRLLVVRRTRATRAVAADFAGQLRIAYPAHPDDALTALTKASTAWPGPAMV